MNESSLKVPQHKWTQVVIDWPAKHSYMSTNYVTRNVYRRSYRVHVTDYYLRVWLPAYSVVSHLVKRYVSNITKDIPLDSTFTISSTAFVHLEGNAGKYLSSLFSFNVFSDPATQLTQKPF